MESLQVFYNHITYGREFLDDLYDRFGYAIDAIGKAILNHCQEELWIHSTGEEVLDFIDGNGFEVNWAPKNFPWGTYYSFKIIFPCTPAPTVTMSITYVPETYNTYMEYNQRYIPDIPEIRNPSRKQIKPIVTVTSIVRYDEIDQPP